MSICSRIDAGLRKQGWIIKLASTDDAGRVGELVDLICQNDADGRAYRHALRHWRAGERPVIERYAGYKAWLEVEGPCYISGDQGYPLGSQLHDGSRWFNLYPDDTNELVRNLREAIDQVLVRWTQMHPCKGMDLDIRELRERKIDDDTAREMIAMRGWSNRSEERGSDDR